MTTSPGLMAPRRGDTRSMTTMSPAGFSVGSIDGPEHMEISRQYSWKMWAIAANFAKLHNVSKASKDDDDDDDEDDLQSSSGSSSADHHHLYSSSSPTSQHQQQHQQTHHHHHPPPMMAATDGRLSLEQAAKEELEDLGGLPTVVISSAAV
mmetsp:Transcript_37123/g.119049  ORF Transcript_37123/g.119049 Transcript_37123/m.119049 type:complete len:151 (-) Transcript_37123:454-906(-)